MKILETNKLCCHVYLCQGTLASLKCFIPGKPHDIFKDQQEFFFVIVFDQGQGRLLIIQLEKQRSKI